MGHQKKLFRFKQSVKFKFYRHKLNKMIANGHKSAAKQLPTFQSNSAEGATRLSAKPPIRGKKSNTVPGKENHLKQNSASVPHGQNNQASTMHDENNSNQHNKYHQVQQSGAAAASSSGVPTNQNVGAPNTSSKHGSQEQKPRVKAPPHVPRLPISSRSHSAQQHSSPNFPPRPAQTQKLSSNQAKMLAAASKVLNYRPPTAVAAMSTTSADKTLIDQPFRSLQQIHREEPLAGTGCVNVIGGRHRQFDDLHQAKQQLQQSQDLSTLVPMHNLRGDVTDNCRPQNVTPLLEMQGLADDRKLLQRKNKLRQKEIIGRRVDAPHIIVAQGVRDEMESLEQGYMAHKQQQIKGSRSPPNNRNLYGQVRLGFGQRGQSGYPKQTSSALQDKARTSKSMEQMKQQQAGFRRPQTSHGTAQGGRSAQRPAQNLPKKTKQVSMIEFLDSSMQERAGNSAIQIQNQQQATQHQHTLNILTATADQFHQGSKKGMDPAQRPKQSKSAAAKSRPHQTHDRQDRNLIQTKYLNFQREVNAKKRGKSAESRGAAANPGGQANHKKGKSGNTNIARVQNPFQQLGQQSKAARGNIQTLDIEARGRSRSKTANKTHNSNNLLSDSPDKSKSRSSDVKRAKSGEDSQGRKHALASSSYSPRSRSRSNKGTTTQFVEARSLLADQRSRGSGVSADSRKKNRSGKHKAVPDPSKQRSLPARQAATQMAHHSTPGLERVQGAVGAIAGPADKNNQSVQYDMRYSNDHLKTVNDAQVGNQSLINADRSHSNMSAGRKNNQVSQSYIIGSSKMLNASLGRMAAQVGASHGGSISPKAGENAQGAQISRPQTQISNFKPGDNKVDRLIMDNLKREKQKSLQRRIREKEEQADHRRKRLELEMANERVRKINKEKVKRRQQQQLLLQTNAIMEAAAEVEVAGGESQGDQTLNLEKNLQNMLARNEGIPNAELSNEMSRLLESLHNDQKGKGADRLYKRDSKPLSALETKQQAARTQKLEMKFNSQQRLEGLTIPENSQLLGKAQKKLKVPKADQSAILPRRRGSLETEDKKEKKRRSQERAQQTLVPAEIEKLPAKRFKDHRRSYGLEFIDIRKEIVSELKQIGHRLNLSSNKVSKRLNVKKPKEMASNKGEKGKTGIVDTSALLNLRASKSQRQALVAKTDEDDNEDEARPQYLKGAIFKGSTTAQHGLTAAARQEAALNKAHRSMISGPVLKKERIRKFMKDKQKQHTTEQERNKLAEIQKTMKVHQNLLKLDKYAKKKLKTGYQYQLPATASTTKAGGASQISLRQPRHQNTQLHQRKNMTLVHEQPELEAGLSANAAGNLTITPNKILNFEVSEPSFNVSGKPNRKANREHRRSGSRDCSQEDNKKISIQMSTLEENKQTSKERQERVDRLHQLQLKKERDWALRQQQANKSAHELAPQFENSSSAKTLERQLKEAQQPSQSPPALQSRTAHKVEQTRSTASRTAPLRPGKAAPKNLRIQKKNAGSKPKKRARSITRGSGGPSAYPASRLNVKVPDPSDRVSRKNLDRMSIQTLKGLQPDDSLAGSMANRSYTLAQQRLIEAQMPMSQDNAAAVIQSNVRRFLKTLGFYEAREVSSPDREPQISLFIEKRGRSDSRSRKTSPEQCYDLQETTVIAELSGYKKDDILGHLSSAKGSQKLSPRPELDHDIANLENEFMRQHGHRLAGGSNMQIIDQVLPSQVLTSNSFVERDTLQGSPPKQNKQHALRQPKRRQHHSSSSERDKASYKKKGRKSQKAPPSHEKQQRQDKSAKQQRELAHQRTEPEELNHRQKLSDAYRAELAKGESNLNHLTRHAAQIQQETKSVQTPSSKHQGQVILPERTSLKSASVAPISPTASNFDIHQVQLSVESRPSMDAPLNMNNLEVASQSSNSMFDRNAFQQFSQKKLNVIMQNNEYSKLLKFREEMLKFRERREKKIIKKQLNQNQFSPRTYKHKKQQIEGWVQVEKQEIEKTKTTFQEEWDKTVQMIEDTQKNMEQMKTKMGVSGSVSAASMQKQQMTNGSAHKPSANQFNSQSCQSLSSHRNYNNGFNNGIANTNSGAGLNNVLGSSEHQRSILIEDPPKSYRSGRQEMPIVPILPGVGGMADMDEAALNSMGVLSSRRSGNNPTAGQENMHGAQSLLQYMEQRLANHKEQSQASLSEFKVRERDYMDGDAGAPAQSLTDQKEFGQSIGLGASESKMQSLRRLSNGESEDSHQPSAEFVERLEKVRIDSNVKDLENEVFAVDGPMPPSIISLTGSDDPNQIHIQENTFIDANLKDEADFLDQLRSKDAGGKMNQVITIKDFGLLDSKRTSGVSELSIEKNLENVVMTETEAEMGRQQLLQPNGVSSPTAEHLEEPSIVAGRESQQAGKTDLGNNIRISDMLKQTKDIGQILHLQQQKQSDQDDLLQEPAIISSSQTLESNNGKMTTFDNPSTLIAAKVRPLEGQDAKSILASESAKAQLLDQITEDLFQSLLADGTRVEPRSKPSSGQPEEGKEKNHDVYYIDQLQSEKEERKEWIDLRQRHLIENDLIRIDQYINEIVDALLQFEIDFSSEEDSLLESAQKKKDKKEIKKDDNYHIQFLKQLTQPIQKEAHTTLQNLQTSEIGSYKHFETTQDLQKYPIIPVDLYLEIEKAREEAMLARKGPNTSKQTQLVWESIHIQNKGFFDAVNESLMKFRPYGLTGEPMPWSNKVRRLQTKVEISSVDTERLFQMVKQEVFRWGQTFCGCLPSPVFCFPGHSRADHSVKEEFNDELFQENREKRLTQVLSAETIEQEHHWLNYEYEEAQVKIDLSDMILEHLVDELVGFLIVKVNGEERASTVEIEELSPERATPTPSVQKINARGLEAAPPTSPFVSEALMVPQQEVSDNLSQGKMLSGDKTIQA